METVLGVMQYTKLIDMQYDVVMNDMFKAFWNYGSVTLKIITWLTD